MSTNEIEQIEQSRVERGNTNSRTTKQDNQYTYWFFTLNNYKIEQIEQIEQLFRHECKWYIFQEEVGKEGTPHLQGTICLKIKQRMSQLKKIDPAIHWEATKSVKASIEYCTKYETRTGKIYNYGIELPEPLKLYEPKGWQLEILDIIKSEPDERSIHWYWSKDGSKGKTQLCKYLIVKHGALTVGGKSSDMYHMIVKNPNNRKIILVNVPKSVQDYINYGAIEHIKDGLIFSGKYESCQLVFNCPHVIVFSNEPPDMSKMSLDRWKIREITDLGGVDKTTASFDLH